MSRVKKLIFVFLIAIIFSIIYVIYIFNIDNIHQKRGVRIRGPFKNLSEIENSLKPESLSPGPEETSASEDKSVKIEKEAVESKNIEGEKQVDPYLEGLKYYNEGNLTDASKKWSEWIRGFPLNSYTIQVELSCKKISIDENFETLSKNGKIYVLERDFKGKKCYRVLMGIYKTKEEAKLFIEKMPKHIRDQRPIIKKISEFL
jgi:hypothetical protein